MTVGAAVEARSVGCPKHRDAERNTGARSKSGAPALADDGRHRVERADVPRAHFV